MNVPSNSQSASNEGLASPAGDTILVVDDHPELCAVATLFLERAGYHVLTANHGEAAKTVARANSHIDLLLTAVEMPVMLGDELAEWFHIVRPETAVVFMSGDPTHRNRMESSYFVERPFVYLGNLLKTIRLALQQERIGEQTVLRRLSPSKICEDEERTFGEAATPSLAQAA